MIYVNCQYSAAEHNKSLSFEEKTEAMKKCADAGCVRCRNGYYGNGPRRRSAK